EKSPNSPIMNWTKHSGPPALYRLYTTRSNLDKHGKIRKWTFGQKCANMQNKIILMVGETGTGKTTLINTMANYFLGVKFEDQVWFEITEEDRRDQTESQTSEITAYEIFSERKLASLTIIDTPGYGDTRGIDKDMEIAQNLHELFLHETGVKSLDAVCLVLKASQNRISEFQRYIFEAVLSLFGKDIEDIIVLFITHSDGGPPTNVLEAIKKEKIPCCHDEENEPVHFLFNNRQSEKQTKKYEYVYRSSWEMATDNIKEFFRFLKSRQRKSLNMTVSVLEERMQLKACVENLKERIKYSEAKRTELTYVQQALKQNKEKIEKDKKFMFTVKIAYKEKVDTSGASWQDRKVTSCKECEENCHEFGCWLAGSPRLCKVMKESHCIVCHCHYSTHVREHKKYVTNANEEEKRSLVNDAYVAIVKLSEIALKPDSAFTVQYLDFLIPRVEEVGTAGWAQKLKDMQKAADKESTKSAVGYLSSKLSVGKCPSCHGGGTLKGTSQYL
uniref:AAA+ ATPase domain-containing protein n=1 Tax=Pygocentrus nattereri TaxID=42514 RepID=A0AAR2IGV7_PYGNA